MPTRMSPAVMSVSTRKPTAHQPWQRLMIRLPRAASKRSASTLTATLQAANEKPNANSMNASTTPFTGQSASAAMPPLRGMPNMTSFRGPYRSTMRAASMEPVTTPVGVPSNARPNAPSDNESAACTSGKREISVATVSACSTKAAITLMALLWPAGIRPCLP